MVGGRRYVSRRDLDEFLHTPDIDTNAARDAKRLAQDAGRLLDARY
jgi:hypothetical protein